MAGRGSFTEAFDLFGYDLENYDELFIEKLKMLLKMNESEILDWQKVNLHRRLIMLVSTHVLMYHFLFLLLLVGISNQLLELQRWGCQLYMPLSGKSIRL